MYVYTRIENIIQVLLRQPEDLVYCKLWKNPERVLEHASSGSHLTKTYCLEKVYVNILIDDKTSKKVM